MKYQTPTPAPLAPAVDLPPREAYSASLRLLTEIVRRGRDPLLQTHWLLTQADVKGRTSEQDRTMIRLMADVLEKVHPVYWSRDIPVPPFRGLDEPLIQEDIRARLADPVLNDAFIYFEEPVLIPGHTSLDLSQTVDLPIRAIGIGVAPPELTASYADVVLAFSDLSAARQAIPLVIALKLGERDRLMPPAWYNGGAVPEDGPAQRYLWRLAYHCLSFMSQRVEVARERGPANHATRKEAERTFRRAAPEITIVHYRRPAVPAERSDPTGRHLTVQFEVDGFWRNQRVGPGRQEVRRTWVHGFRKGPADAPWHRPAVKIAAVVR